jgi:hypothetical protein
MQTTGAVLLTTRKKNVATHLEMPAYVHLLKRLDEDQSWELFSSRALPPYRRCMLAQVSDFEFIGKRLAKKCEGLEVTSQTTFRHRHGLM